MNKYIIVIAVLIVAFLFTHFDLSSDEVSDDKEKNETVDKPYTRASKYNRVKETQYEIPSSHDAIQQAIISHTGFSLAFNTNTNCPDWVAWELTSKELSDKSVKRSDDFRPDPLLPEAHRVETFDYKGTGYDRGHMCPAADMKWNQKAMDDCFLMSNICPQKPQLNQKWWEHLETACRRWAKREGNIYICCGPIFSLFDNNTSSNNPIPNTVKTRKPKIIGKCHKVSVPTAFFKVIMSLRKGEEKAIGFIYKNSDARQTMEEAMVTVDSVENLTGYDFFPKVDAKLQEKVESTCDLQSWR